MDFLSDEEIDEIEKPEPKGPVTWHDREMRCASRGCSSPTYIRVNGVERCTAHALRILNEMLMEEAA